MTTNRDNKSSDCNNSLTRSVYHPAPTPAAGSRRSRGGGRRVISMFARHQRGRGFSERTVKRRVLTLKQVAAHLAPKDLAEATTTDLEEWLVDKPSARTRHAYRSDLRVFFQWAVKRGLIERDPTVGLDPIRVPKSLPRPFGPEIDALLYTGSRSTRQMVALGLFAGLRCMEIANLRAEDIWLHAEPPVVVVRDGKGGKDRVVPLCTELRAMLEPLPPAGVLFAGRDGVTPIRADSVGDRLRHHLRCCGIIGTPHQLRHTFGTAAARRTGGNLLMVAAWMGHESTETTARYTKLTAAGAHLLEDLYGTGPKGDAA